jgi:hypothetical protein
LPVLKFQLSDDFFTRFKDIRLDIDLMPIVQNVPDEVGRSSPTPTNGVRSKKKTITPAPNPEPDPDPLPDDDPDIMNTTVPMHSPPSSPPDDQPLPAPQPPQPIIDRISPAPIPRPPPPRPLSPILKDIGGLYTPLQKQSILYILATLRTKMNDRLDLKDQPIKFTDLAPTKSTSRREASVLAAQLLGIRVIFSI